jgi:hypothetical protein
MKLTAGSPRREVALVIAAMLGALALSPATLASQPAEPQQGAQILTEVRAGSLGKLTLSAGQYRSVGQYLMGRALGSTQTYEAMDSLMDRMMGEAAADRMYTYLGERYLGRDVAPDNRDAPLYGWMGSMMSAYRGSSPYAGMMRGYLSRQAGETSNHPGAGMMGYGYAAGAAGGGWPTGAIIVVSALAAALLLGGILVARPKLRDRNVQPRRPSAPPA